NLRTLEALGLVEIVMVETDLRRRAVWLTEAGARRLQAAIPVWRATNARLARLLSADLASRLAEDTASLPVDWTRRVGRVAPNAPPKRRAAASRRQLLRPRNPSLALASRGTGARSDTTGCPSAWSASTTRPPPVA